MPLLWAEEYADLLDVCGRSQSSLVHQGDLGHLGGDGSRVGNGVLDPQKCAAIQGSSAVQLWVT